MKINNKGITLIELLVALGIFSLLSLVVAWILISSLRSSRTIDDQLQSQSDGRRVLQQVVDEIRKAEDSSIGSYPIENAVTSSLIFFANADADGYRERIRFYLDNTTLKKGVIKPSGSPLTYNSANEQIVEIAHDIKNNSQNIPLFSYYDENYFGTGAALTYPLDVTSIRVVKVQLEIERDPVASPVPLHVETQVHIRNLKTN